MNTNQLKVHLQKVKHQTKKSGAGAASAIASKKQSKVQKTTPKMFLPISLDISDRNIVLIGGGKTAFQKAFILSKFTSELTIIAPEFHQGFETLPFTLIQKTYEPADLDGASLVYVCTEQTELNASVKGDCAKRQILANVVDNPSLSDFVSPAIHKVGNVTISVGSNAQNVRQSIRIRNQIKELEECGVILLTEAKHDKV
jgi:siroheme synthase-like protein